ncbi:MAG TPA: protein kinase [Polyangiaceae bacterium]|nr:protein kinase [Polyangiaceae bacterium]
MSLENSLVLSRYRVLWLVDQKKLAKTYIARDEAEDAFGTPVLVKQFLHDLGDQESPGVRTLFDELTTLTHLRHTGVVSLLNYGVVDDHLVTASSHLPGAGLPQLCEHFARRQRPFPPHLAIYILRRLLQTLHHCHTRDSRSFVHGRITLGCIHIPTSGEPQVMDFGLASLEDVAAEAESQLGFFQTRMSFAAPEITRGGTPTPHGDTYSLALLLYRLLAGNNPFRGRSIPETLQRVLQLTPAPLTMPEWEPCAQINAILGRALAKDPSTRHRSCLELSDDLANVQVGTYDTLAEELSTLVRSNSTADWRQIARLTRSVRKSQPPRDSARRDRERRTGPGLAPEESRAPAFVSGLLTDQPISVAEHTQRDREQARLRRQRKRRLAMLPTVLLPAAAIIMGLFLGRLGGAGESPAAARPASAISTAPLVDGAVADLKALLRQCVEHAEGRTDTKVELEFGVSGQLAEVRLHPADLSQTRLGACLLKRVWDAGVSAPAAMLLVIPLAD